MRITVIGTGYVGLVTAACLAQLGHTVTGADSSDEKIAVLASGGITIWEPGLLELLREMAALNRIHFTTDLQSAIQDAEVLIICVGTPVGWCGEADLKPVWSVVQQIAEYTTGKKYVIVKSTVPVGTTDEIDHWLGACSSSSAFEVIHNPEFLRQGTALHDFFHPDRIVAGCRSEITRSIIEELYEPIPAPIHFCDRRSAELIKYASNAFLAMKISFINMIADFSERAGSNIDIVAEGIGMDHRIGGSFLRAGIGYGGSCFPKDIQAFKAMGQEWNCPLPLLDATEAINVLRPKRLVDKLVKCLGTLKDKRITLLGLTFKPMTDDLREAPSLEISRQCLSLGAAVHAYDPFVNEYPISEVILYRDLYTALDSADALVILTEWEQLQALDWSIVMERLRSRIIIDGRNLFAWEHMRQLAEAYDFTYESIGRPPIDTSAAFHAADWNE